MSEDREAQFLRLLEAHGAAIRRLTAGYERDAGRREDLEQEIHLAIWQALPAFAGQCSERTFVFRIAHNRAISHVRHWTIRRSDPLADQAEPVDTTADPERAASDAARHAGLTAAVRALPPSGRQVILLLLEGFSHREVADVLGISEGNVAVRASRARKTLTEALASGEYRS